MTDVTETTEWIAFLSGALVVYASIGDITGVKRVLAQGADIHVDDEGPLRQAVSRGYTNIVKVMLEAGADPYIWSSWPMELAQFKGHTKVVAVLEAAMKKN